MIPRECKRLAEVDFPIAEVSRHAAREKSIRHGHPSTLHLWWARRPLASSRAMLMALLLPDPCDEHCPEAFKKEAREILLRMHGRPSGWEAKIEPDEGLRQIILKFIADFANWDNAADRSYLETSRALIRAAHPEEPPLVVDPFAGGGSIPLEALRLGCEAFASDLNPVACLILKVMLEDIPRHGPELADELRKVGGEIKAAAEKELADLYPADPDGATPIAYLWARTVRCESPNCGAEIPLLRSLWLCKKAKRRRALRTKVVRPNGQPPQVELAVFEPTSEREVAAGTVSNGKAICLCCETVLPAERVRVQLSEERGGADAVFDAKGNRTGGARMTAVVTLRPGEQGRHYRLATAADYAAVGKAQEKMVALLEDWECEGKQGPCPVPDEKLNPIRPSPNARGLSAVTRCGMSTFGNLFTARQKLALLELGSAVQKLPSDALGPIQATSAMAIGRTSDYNSANCRWVAGGEFIANTFGRQALPIVWDFAEVCPLAESTGSFIGAIGWIAKVVEVWPKSDTGQVQAANAADHPLPDESADVWFTDPPYYDAIPYADLSDFFLVWLKRTLPDHPLLGDPFDLSNPLSPKQQECVWNQAYDYEGQPKDAAFFEMTMARAFGEGRRVLRAHGVGSVVFAHQTTEGWEAFLGGLVPVGWTVTAAWPIATERASRLRARDNASLATSVHLICRPRPDDAPVGDWADVLRELPPRVAAWIERLQREGIRGADLVFACIGPALEIFSRYRAVETAEGREVGLPEYLEKVWEVVGHAALKQVLGSGDATGALEEDARLTALFLWTLQSTEAPEENAKKKEDEEEPVAKVAAKGFSLPFDVVRRFAQPMGIDLDVWTDRVIGQDKGVVRLLPVAERAKALFGEDGTRAAADWIESDTGGDLQAMLFPEMEAAPKKKAHRRGKKAILSGDAELHSPDATTLDRVHAAMLLQSGGQANALRKLIGAEQERGPDFLRLANALSALYPKGSEEKRLLDAMLLAVPR
jgi:putative DNA methylase